MIQADLTGGRLTKKQILEFIAQHPRKDYQDNDEYAAGRNVEILNRKIKDASAPHNRIPVSYARKIVNTVSGYMYKPGLITYTSDKEQYIDATQEVFYQNNEDVKTSLIGRQTSIHGVGYELHYTDGTSPRFAKIAANEMIPVYSYDVEEKLVAAIRHYPRGDIWKVEVYYDDVITYFDMQDSATRTHMTSEETLVQTGELPHLYGVVPVVVYSNNEEHVGDFAPVKGLIDAYDVLVSDALNEFDRFAYAYLVLKGLTMDGETARDVKEKRIFNGLPADAAVNFLTKEIPAGFVDFMTGLVRREIHKQSHVPDFTEVVTGTFTGAALDRLLYDFELIAAEKEALFKKGLYRRLELIDKILEIQGKIKGDPRDVEIIMSRNKPSSLIETGDAMQRYRGLVSDQTLIENFAPFVANAQEEMDKLAAESSARMPSLTDEDETDDEP